MQKFTWGNLCTSRDLLNEALNKKMCKNEKSIKFIFTYKKVILDFNKAVVNSKKISKNLNCFLKKTRNFFLSSDFRFEISAKISFKKRLHPDAPFSKKFPYGTAAL